jgi:hypothetical protein
LIIYDEEKRKIMIHGTTQSDSIGTRHICMMEYR